MDPEFREFPKIHRYSREVVVTEKIDGTNAAIIIEGGVVTGMQSRTRLIKPGDDNAGFAFWVDQHKAFLAEKLQDGHHYGEWWGQGIQRRYGLNSKRFSLFNVSRWTGHTDDEKSFQIGLSVVPTLWRGQFDELNAASIMALLKEHGSYAAPGFMDPEGIVIFHTQGNFLLKKTFDKDESGKTHGA